MYGLLASLTAAWLAATQGPARPADLAFKPADEQGLYRFDTGVLRGKARLGGQSQGITEVVHVPSGVAVASGGRLPGLFSYYRIFSANRRYGNAARDWPTTTKVLPDGALEVFWPAADEHPLEMTAVYRFVRPDTLDVETIVKPLVDMPALEVFLSSYYEKGFHAQVLVKPQRGRAQSDPFMAVDRGPDSKGGYVTFPLDERALGIIQDGRWKIPPNPVDWDVVRWLEAPVALRRDQTSGVTAVMMAPREDCFAVFSPYNPASPDAGGYRSLYLSFFGRDLKAGQSARARCRLVIRRGLSDQEVIELYRQYLQEQEEKPVPPDRPSRTVELTEAESGKTVTVAAGASVVVSLAGNPTTGYSWQVDKIDGDAVEQAGKIDYKSRPHARGMVGVGGTFFANFKAVKPGTATVTLHYARPWEKDKAPAKTVRLTLRVVEGR